MVTITRRGGHKGRIGGDIPWVREFEKVGRRVPVECGVGQRVEPRDEGRLTNSRRGEGGGEVRWMEPREERRGRPLREEQGRL